MRSRKVTTLAATVQASYAPGVPVVATGLNLPAALAGRTTAAKALPGAQQEPLFVTSRYQEGVFGHSGIRSNSRMLPLLSRKSRVKVLVW